MASMEKSIELCENVLNKKKHTHGEVCVYLCNDEDKKKQKKIK